MIAGALCAALASSGCASSRDATARERASIVRAAQRFEGPRARVTVGEIRVARSGRFALADVTASYPKSGYVQESEWTVYRSRRGWISAGNPRAPKRIPHADERDLGLVGPRLLPRWWWKALIPIGVLALLALGVAGDPRPPPPPPPPPPKPKAPRYVPPEPKTSDPPRPKRLVPCPAGCDGGRTRCWACGGTGQTSDPPGPAFVVPRCPHCSGGHTGMCSQCGGRGLVEETY